ncbi:Rid family hydrolase [Rhodococcus sp. IEGM 1379]|uniref:Rid family hydrolase n=1 Tax=Rhodococcus sp. IEGM 1379 TaxID=3047086 RepID=UPI0024B65039|nr:Rid family hydrolase [Rhodococcus sp. IEGM 1379]MDI9915055.1 Rid family hydrolase [Rhodococcus sp. IEGM 1379]
MKSRTTKVVAAAFAATVLLGTATACTTDTAEADTAKSSFISKSVLEAGQANPMIAQGVAIGADTAVYKTSGIGPSAGNKTAPEGSPESYIDSQFSGGVLPAGVSVTEAQGINVLKKIRDNLEAQGLSLEDVVTMRVFLDNAPGADKADYTGWNRAYRQFFANTNLDTGDTELVPMGTAAPIAPIERNSARPTRFALEVAGLPIAGWLVEVEVDAVYPEGKEPA